MFRKFRSIAVLLLCVMMFSVAAPALAEYRTGSATGDALAYGAGGALIGTGAAAVTTIAILGTGGLAAGPLCAAGGLGGVIGGTYGALDDNKTLAKDLIFAGGITLAGAGIGAVGAATKTAQEVGILGQVVAEQENKIRTLKDVLDSMDPYEYIEWAYYNK